MALTSEQRNVFLLAMEKIETFNSQAMDHASYSCVSSRKNPGMNVVVEWAIDYISCLPDDSYLAGLIVRAHVGTDDKWSRNDIRRCGGACRGFYRRVLNKRLFGAGLKYI
jgi:hypothetical protein